MNVKLDNIANKKFLGQHTVKRWDLEYSITLNNCPRKRLKCSACLPLKRLFRDSRKALKQKNKCLSRNGIVIIEWSFKLTLTRKRLQRILNYLIFDFSRFSSLFLNHSIKIIFCRNDIQTVEIYISEYVSWYVRNTNLPYELVYQIEKKQAVL